MPTLKRADMPGGSDVGRVAPTLGWMTRMHLTTASTISSLLNCLMLSISSLTCLGITKQVCSCLNVNAHVLLLRRLTGWSREHQTPT